VWLKCKAMWPIYNNPNMTWVHTFRHWDDSIWLSRAFGSSCTEGRVHVIKGAVTWPTTWPIEKTEQRREGFIWESKQRNFLVCLEGTLYPLTSWRREGFLCPPPLESWWDINRGRHIGLYTSHTQGIGVRTLPTYSSRST